MDVRRLDELLDAYGADPRRWPEGERAAAEALLASSPALRAHVDETARLDALLDALPAEPAPSPRLRAQVLASSPRRPRSVRRMLVAAALPLAAGLLLWFSGPADGPVTPDPKARLVAAGKTMNLAKADEVDLPTDDLLTLASGDDEGLTAAWLIDDVPTIGCSAGSGLGCPDLEVLPEAQSRAISSRGRLTA
jgi:anti-sigma factor RsiW